MIRIRPFTAADQDFVLSLAPRLVIGMRPWRDRALWLKAVEGWLTDSIARGEDRGAVFVAEDEAGERLGFATVAASEHFTSQPQAYIGELATDDVAEGRGVGRALVTRCEEWARAKGFAVITLTTGAGNDRALGFYRRLGYVDEDVTLTRRL